MAWNMKQFEHVLQRFKVVLHILKHYMYPQSDVIEVAYPRV